ncbi:hypothetical protein OG21DRAFT_1493819 [Imleria badia]|nr:hypothetical protein OG21DRAFT_1493819 [Imleria badia]
MSSQLQSAVSSIVNNNYATVLTAIGYDYILTISYEIEYVWNKPRGWVSILFVLVRYFGLCNVIIYSLIGSSFLPGPEKVSVILGVLGEWAMLVFIGAADLVMILRVCAMYGLSRTILGVLITLYALEIISFIITCIIVSTKLPVVTTQVLHFSYCLVEFDSYSPIWAEVRDTLQFTLAAVMCLLVTTKFIRHAFQMYNMTKQWQFSRYLNLFAKEGMLYFFAILLFGLVNLLAYVAKIVITGWRIIPMGILNFVPVLTLTPRFVLSMRALYARDLRGRCEPCHMDTGFGFTSASESGTRGSTILFVDVGLSEEGLEQDEDIPMEEWGKRRAVNGF